VTVQLATIAHLNILATCFLNGFYKEGKYVFTIQLKVVFEDLW